MPLRGLRRSPCTRPRKARRDSRASRSSWARNSADSSGVPRTIVLTKTGGSPLVERLEVLLDVRLVVARHLLPRDGLLHHLPVLAHDAEVLHAGRHVRALAEEVGVVALLAARARFALDAHVERVDPETLRRIALGAPALAATRQAPLALRPLALLARPAALPAVAAARAAPPVALSAAPEGLAVAALLLELAHLVEGPLHRLHRAVGLAPLERFHALGDVAAHGVLATALAPEPLHLVEELAE